MSALEVYVIRQDGEVVALDDIRNPHGAAPHIWLMQKGMLALVHPQPATSPCEYCGGRKGYATIDGWHDCHHCNGTGRRR